ncbi:ABC transporter substrate binding protein, partial [Streptococcus iniae]
MKKKRLMLAVLTAFMVLPLVACRKEGVADNSKVSIGIMQYAEHPALDSAREGFMEALAEGGYKEGKNLKVTLKNAQGEQSNLQTMVEQLAGKNNLNFAIATPAAQALLNTDPET